MDSLRGGFSEENEPDMPSVDDDAADDARTYSARSLASGDERRMQVRAYNFWASLLGNRIFPDVADLHPEELNDFGPNSVLLDFTQGLENPLVTHLGAQLAEECGADGAIRRLGDVPARSMLTRITDHYLQIIANQAPIGFEAEFVNQRGTTILYRGVLLPFSRDDARIEYIYGVINWKELAEQDSGEAPMQRMDEPVEARPAMLRDPLDAPLTEWADGPADFSASPPHSSGHSSFVLPEPGFPLGDAYERDETPEVAAGHSPRLIDDLRALEARPLQTVASKGEEFTVLVARRLASGEVLLLGEISDDEALLERAARRLLR